MLPIPKHLTEILIPMGNENSEFRVDGVIRCSCGCETFAVSVFGGESEHYPEVLCVNEYEDDFGLMVKVKCMDCQKNHLVFDMHEHGWNGFVCHEGITVPDEALSPWKCKKCGSDVHHMTLSILSQGKEDFIENLCDDAGANEKYDENHWTEAFEWITANIVCFHCGHENEGWIDFETM